MSYEESIPSMWMMLVVEEVKGVLAGEILSTQPHITTRYSQMNLMRIMLAKIEVQIRTSILKSYLSSGKDRAVKWILNLILSRTLTFQVSSASSKGDHH